MTDGVVLVTGANGFVGRAVVRELARAGTPVRAMVRAPGADFPVGVETAVASLEDADALRRACEGVDAVVHLAARVHVMRDTAADPLAAFRRVNVDGTRALLDAAITGGATRFVHASSVKAVGESSGITCWNDATVPRPVDPYGVSKLEAEAVVRERAAEAGISGVSLRFPLVYGPGVKGNMLRLFQVISRGRPLPLGGIANRRSLAAVGNVAAAVLAVLSAPAAVAGRAFYVSDGEDLSSPELARRIGIALGRPARIVPLPSGLLRLAARAGDVAAKVIPFPLTTPAVNRLLGSLCVDTSALRAATGWSPPVSVDEGLREVAVWFRQGGAA